MNSSDMFSVESVEPCEVPSGVGSGEWCRYVVSGPRTRIVGRFRGSPRQARKNAEGLVTDINARAATGKSPWIPRARRRTR